MPSASTTRTVYAILMTHPSPWKTLPVKDSQLLSLFTVINTSIYYSNYSSHLILFLSYMPRNKVENSKTLYNMYVKHKACYVINSTVHQNLFHIYYLYQYTAYLSGNCKLKYWTEIVLFQIPEKGSIKLWCEYIFSQF
jgi:hypothetical protein